MKKSICKVYLYVIKKVTTAPNIHKLAAAAETLKDEYSEDVSSLGMNSILTTLIFLPLSVRKQDSTALSKLMSFNMIYVCPFKNKTKSFFVQDILIRNDDKEKWWHFVRKDYNSHASCKISFRESYIMLASLTVCIHALGTAYSQLFNFMHCVDI